MLVPPRFIRRIVFVPLVLVITLAVLVLSPLLLMLALVATPSRRARRRALRLLWFGTVWLVMESLALVACLALWVASGFGGRLASEPYQRRHYALVRWFLAELMRLASRIFKLTVVIEEPPATPEELAARLTRPVIVLSRHAGPGDSFLLVHNLLSRYGRQPRIVMKAALQLDPIVDVVINRLPHAFVRPRRQAVPAVVPSGPTAAAVAEAATGTPDVGVADAATGTPDVGVADAATGTPDRADSVPDAPSAVIAEIRRLAAGLDDTAALVIFPEGGNFTPNRRVRGIRRLEQNRRHDEARRAREMEYLLAPRSGGVYAAVNAAPTADVIFVAHTGVDDLITVGDVWRALPMEQTIKAKWWRVPAAQVPRDRERLLPWLYDWWAVIDAWIAENRPVRSVTPTAQRVSGDSSAYPSEPTPTA